MRRLLVSMVVLFLACAPALADEIADTLRAALAAYEAGDIAAAHEDATYAAQLLAQKKASGLEQFLPDALPGWTRSIGETQAHAAVMFGGGMSTQASYTSEAGENIEIQLLADSPMASMFANPAMMSMFGQVRRINRVNFAISPEGEIQGMVGSVLVQVSGSASEEHKIAHIEQMDLRGLAAF